MRGLAINQRRSRRRRVAAEDGALREIEVAAAGVVDDGVFLVAHGALIGTRHKGLAAVVDEYIDARAIDEDNVGRLRRVNEHVRVVDEIHVGTQPGGRQLPRLLMLKADRDERTLSENLAELRLLLVQKRLADRELLRLTFRCVDQRDPVTHLGQRRIDGVLMLHGLVRNDVEQFADAAIGIRRIVPAINAIDDVKPEGHLLLREEVAEHLQRRARLRVDRIGLCRPVRARRRMMINALNGERTRLRPGGTLDLVKADIHHEHVTTRHLLGMREAGARGRHGVHLDVRHALVGQRRVREERGGKAVNAVAVEENRGSHDELRVTKKEGRPPFQFF